MKPPHARGIPKRTTSLEQIQRPTTRNHMEPYLENFNLETYKYHLLGDYIAMICRFGTTDSYSTTMVFTPSTATTLFLITCMI